MLCASGRGRRYVRPKLTEEPVLEAVAGRHPVIEQWMEETREGRFIANDLYLCASQDLLQKVKVRERRRRACCW